MAAEYEYYAGTVKTILRAGDDSALGIGQHDAMAIFSAVSFIISAKCSMLPPISQAMAAAASLALSSMTA